MGNLDGRVALVTGAAGDGMGRSIALTLAREGAAVAVNFRRSGDRARAVVDAITGMGGRAAAVQADVSDAPSVAALERDVAAALGPIDILVHSAGGPWKPQDITGIEPEHLRRVVAAEIESTYWLLRAVLPAMRDRGWGRVVLIGGHMADQWRFGPPEAPLDYPMGKAARHWLVRTLAPREASRGITINAVAPGPTRRFSLDEAIAAVRSGPPPGGDNTPAHIAETVAWLCGSERVTGAIIDMPGSRPV